MQIIEALFELYPFESLYIADLDAIQGTGQHDDIVAAIQAQYPDLQILLDAGLRTADQLDRWKDLDLIMVIASECMTSMDGYLEITSAIDPDRQVLSIDVNAEGFMGPPALFHDTEHWPRRMIAMALSTVGSYAGPDIPLLTHLLSRAGHRRVMAAGGVRDIRDVDHLVQQGAAGVLVASALHDGRITASDLVR